MCIPSASQRSTMEMISEVMISPQSREELKPEDRTSNGRKM